MDDHSEKDVKLEIIGTDETCLTFVFHNEDHTLGNALRYVLIRNPDVKFCGYSIPHPSETIMNLRLETFGKPASDIFQDAVRNLRSIAEHLRGTFGAELETFMSSMQDDN